MSPYILPSMVTIGKSGNMGNISINIIRNSKIL